MDESTREKMDQRAVAFEDWAMTTVTKTLTLSREARDALQHRGLKALRGRPIFINCRGTDGEDWMHIMPHGNILSVTMLNVCMDGKRMRGIILRTDALMPDERLGFVPMNLGYFTDGDRTLLWTQIDNDFDFDKELKQQEIEDERSEVNIEIE